MGNVTQAGTWEACLVGPAAHCTWPEQACTRTHCSAVRAEGYLRASDAYRSASRAETQLAMAVECAHAASLAPHQGVVQS